MGNPKHCILIVDDSPEDILVAKNNLNEHHVVLAATNGEEALKIASSPPHPEVAVIDVSKNGYETCAQLKNNPKTQDIHVIFVSSNDKVEHKLAGYNAGGSDYLVKPIVPAELAHKIQLAISHRDVHNTLKKDNDCATKTAMAAMRSAGELGVILKFYRECMLVKDDKTLGKLIVESVAELDVACTVQIRTCFDLLNIGSASSVPPLEQELLFILRDKEGIQELGQRCIMNCHRLSILLKNMPSDEEKRGRLRDAIMILLQGANTCLENLELNKKSGKKEHLLRQVLTFSQVVFMEVKDDEDRHKHKAMEVFEDIKKDLEDTFHSLVLTDEQEQRLVGVVEKGIAEGLKNFEQGQAIKERVQGIVNRLEQYQKI